MPEHPSNVFDRMPALRSVSDGKGRLGPPDATINAPGQFSVELHDNYTLIGRTQPDFAGGSKQ
jgi:hypothetical protein